MVQYSEGGAPRPASVAGDLRGRGEAREAGTVVTFSNTMNYSDSDNIAG